MTQLAAIAESTLAGMGYELVDAQVSGRGKLVRIFIDRLRGGPSSGITLDDCAEVSRQLTRVFAVEGIDYERLEVSSPGLDRPLRKAADFVRFSGRRVQVQMRVPDASGRRRFSGRLQGVAGDATVTVELEEGGRVELPLDGMERARLVPDL
jgi:ribosome maturation factor RimP